MRYLFRWRWHVPDADTLNSSMVFPIYASALLCEVNGDALGDMCAQRCVVLIGNRIFSSNCRFHRLDVIWLLVSATVALRFKYQRLSTPHAIVTATRPHYDAQQTAMHVSDTLSSSSACIRNYCLFQVEFLQPLCECRPSDQL